MFIIMIGKSMNEIVVYLSDNIMLIKSMNNIVYTLTNNKAIIMIDTL